MEQSNFNLVVVGLTVILVAWMLVTGPLQELNRENECRKSGFVCKHIDEWVPEKATICVPVPQEGDHEVG